MVWSLSGLISEKHTVDGLLTAFGFRGLVTIGLKPEEFIAADHALSRVHVFVLIRYSLSLTMVEQESKFGQHGKMEGGTVVLAHSRWRCSRSLPEFYFANNGVAVASPVLCVSYRCVIDGGNGGKQDQDSAGG